MISSLQHILVRELRAMRREILAYEDESDMWKSPLGIANPAGNLAIHVAGNLRTFIGARFGNTGYVRNRDAEFSSRNVPRDEIVQQLDAAIADVETGMAGVTEADLDEPYKPEMLGTVTARDFLLHLSAHLAYHLGQADYHRRIVTGNPDTMDVVAIGELESDS